MSGDDSLRSQVRARDGAVCIYAEERWIARATLSIVSLTDTYLKLPFRCLDTPGFTPPDEPAWEAGVALTEFRFSPDGWMGSPYAVWIVTFAPDIIAAMTGIAQDMKARPRGEREVALWGRLGELLWPEGDEDALCLCAIQLWACVQ